MPDEEEINEEFLSEQTIAERQCGRAAIAKYAMRHEAALAHRAREQVGQPGSSEADQAAASARRLDRNAPPAPAMTVFPVAPEPYQPGKQVSGKK